MSYSPPSSAKPYTLNIPDQDLSEWRQLLQLSKLGPKTYENTQTEHNFGVTQKWLSDAKDHWLNTYDWRAQEKYINSFDNFKMQIESIDLHFIGLFSEKKDAIPIVFMHGWPGSFIEFLPMLKLIKDKYQQKDLPYHIIVPSLPGYTLSAALPTDKNWGMHDTARIVNTLMINLGFSRYLAQGGDVGSMVARIMAKGYDECVGIHLNLITGKAQPDEEKLSTLEKKALDCSKKFAASGRGYMIEHGTRPSTIGHVLSSNPLAMLAWIGEKLLEWSDESPSLDDILTNVSLYWFTSGYPTSLYPYRELGNSYDYLNKPTGVSFFPLELFPAFKSIAEKEFDLVFYKQHDKGGHFAALERPQEIWEDVVEFAGKAWKDGSGAKL